MGNELSSPPKATGNRKTIHDSQSHKNHSPSNNHSNQSSELTRNVELSFYGPASNQPYNIQHPIISIDPNHYRNYNTP